MWAGTVGGLKGEGGRIYAQDVQLGVGLVRAADNTVKTKGECVYPPQGSRREAC